MLTFRPNPIQIPADYMLKKLATIISVLFHPLLIVSYMLVLLLLINPYQFGVYSISEQGKLLLLVFMSTFVMPAFAVFMMKSLGMVQSMALHERQERIGPYIIAGVFYLWMFINFKNNTTIPASLTVAMLGATIGLFTAFFFNNFTKISAHAVGMGGLVGVATINSMFYNFDTFTMHTWLFGTLELSTNFVVMAVVVLTGLVCTSRLLLEAHKPGQLYGGLAAGFLSQFVAFAFLR
ncbi:MAG: hypothetical protein H6577_15005 [Lewinellaceae bacterium]|nr:hypothetical protein [Saprospiraceae bacterium]MCB9339436.1 hypothetical protein [Lewinellaceae bacterium]